jgi:hypothetical protein
MGNPAGTERTKRQKRRLREMARLAAKATAYRAASSAAAEIWRGIEKQPAGGAAQAVAQAVAAAEQLGQRLTLALGRGLTTQVPSVALAPSLTGDNKIEIGLTSDDPALRQHVIEAAEEVLRGTPITYEVVEAPQSVAETSGGPPSFAGGPVAADDRWVRLLLRQRSGGSATPPKVIVGGHSLEADHPPGGRSPYAGTATVGARLKTARQSPRHSTHQLILCKHVARDVNASVHHRTLAGDHVADVARLSDAGDADAALATMRSNWRADARIEGVGPVTAVAAPAPDVVYEVCGRNLGYARACLVPYWYVAQAPVVNLPGGRGPLTLVKQCLFRLVSGQSKRVTVGDSGAPVYFKVPGERGAELVGMLVALRPPGNEFYATPFPAVEAALGTTCH